MTTISERRIAELKAKGTFSYTAVAAMSFIVAACNAAIADGAPKEGDDMISYSCSACTPGTQALPSSIRVADITEVDVFNQLSRVYEELIKNQVELDLDAKRALYTDLWDLYA